MGPNFGFSDFGILSLVYCLVFWDPGSGGLGSGGLGSVDPDIVDHSGRSLFVLSSWTPQIQDGPALGRCISDPELLGHSVHSELTPFVWDPGTSDSRMSVSDLVVSDHSESNPFAWNLDNGDQNFWSYFSDRSGRNYSAAVAAGIADPDNLDCRNRISANPFSVDLGILDRLVSAADSGTSVHPWDPPGISDPCSVKPGDRTHVLLDPCCVDLRRMDRRNCPFDLRAGSAADFFVDRYLTLTLTFDRSAVTFDLNPVTFVTPGTWI